MLGVRQPGTKDGGNKTVSDERNDELDERRALIREVRQRFETLGRAGLVHILAGAKPAAAAPVMRDPRARSGVERPEATPSSVEPRTP